MITKCKKKICGKCNEQAMYKKVFNDKKVINYIYNNVKLHNTNEQTNKKQSNKKDHPPL